MDVLRSINLDIDEIHSSNKGIDSNFQKAMGKHSCEKFSKENSIERILSIRDVTELGLPEPEILNFICRSRSWSQMRSRSRRERYI